MPLSCPTYTGANTCGGSDTWCYDEVGDVEAGTCYHCTAGYFNCNGKRGCECTGGCTPDGQCLGECQGGECDYCLVGDVDVTLGEQDNQRCGSGGAACMVCAPGESCLQGYCVAPQCVENGFCEGWLGEDATTCPADCNRTEGLTCGDGFCESWSGEDVTTCPADCSGPS